MDALDRQIVASMQINGRATWRQIAAAVGTSESTVARRAQALLDQRHVRVTALPDPMRCGLGYPVLAQLRCEVGAAARVARQLADRPDVRFLALVTGTVDIVMELIVPSRRRLAHILLEELTDVEGIVRTTTESVLRTFKTSYDWSEELLAEEARATLLGPTRTALDEVPVALDEIDLQLLQLLSDDGRRTFSDLAAAASIGESMARRRVESLVDRGCLRFATLVDPHLLGYDIELIIWLNVDPASLERNAAILAGCREIRYLSATSGYSDLVCEAVLRSQDDLYAFRTTTLAGLAGTRRVETALELETVKRAYQPMSDDIWRVER